MPPKTVQHPAQYDMGEPVTILALTEEAKRYGVRIGEWGWVYSITEYYDEREPVYAVERERNGRYIRLPESHVMSL